MLNMVTPYHTKMSNGILWLLYQEKRMGNVRNVMLHAHVYASNLRGLTYSDLWLI